MTQDSGIKMPMQCWPSIAQYSRTLKMKGGPLFYYDTGGTGTKNQQALILVHGLGDESDSWRFMIPLLLKKGFRVIAPDLPGFGRSTGSDPGSEVSYNTGIKWKDKISINNHIETVLALMVQTNAAGKENPAIVIGSSMGAMIAQGAAAKRPDLVKSLILIDGCHPLSGGFNPGLLLMAFPFIGRKWYRNFRKNHEGAWKSLYSYYRDLDAMSQEDKAFLRNRVIDRVESSSQEQAYFSSLRSLIGLNIFQRAAFSRSMSKFTGKILLLWGEADTVIPFENTSLFRQIHADADFRKVHNAGHLPHQEVPSETADLITGWLETLQ